LVNKIYFLFFQFEDLVCLVGNRMQGTENDGFLYDYSKPILLEGNHFQHKQGGDRVRALTLFVIDVK